MKLFLIRHGLSEANEVQLVTGTPNDILSTKGIDEVARLNRWLRKCPVQIDCYVSSQWERAYHLFPDANWYIDPRIGETDAGIVANWKLDRFLSQYPHFYSTPENRYPGGESHVDLNKRVLDFLYNVVDIGYCSCAAVTHSGPISCILQHLLGIEMSSFPVFLPSHASLTLVEAYLKDGNIAGRLLTFSSGPIGNINFQA